MGLKDGLVSYYKLDGTSGDVVDSHGTNNGTNNGATRGVTGKINNAFDFDGVDDYIDLGTPSSFDFTDNISASAWIRLEGNPVINNRIFNHGGPSGNDDFAFSVRDSQFWYYLDTTSSSMHSYYGSVNTNTWYHFVVVYDGSTYKMYIDGSEVASKSITGNLVGADGQSWTIGDRNGEWFFDGKIDEVGIWNRALSSTEVSELYNSGNGVTYPFAVVYSASVLNLSTTDQEPEQFLKVSPVNISPSLTFQNTDVKVKKTLGTQELSFYFYSDQPPLFISYPYVPAQSIGTGEIRKDKWTYKGGTYGVST